MTASTYELVVGMEVHAQLATATKLFCGCSTTFGMPANTQTCPVCLGLPGSLPVMNRRAFELCMQTAVGLGCKIPATTTFDRKNYYYPDCPRNYQISQNYAPLGIDGEVELMATGKKVSITNVHLEDDAGKLIHDESGKDRSIVDLNRAGTPLAEIVSGPDMRSLEEVEDYMATLRLLLLHMGVSHCRMQEGNVRFEASISLRPHGSTSFNNRVEIKNLNSTKAVMAALRHEQERQTKLYDTGVEVEQETRLWDDANNTTARMRSKEDAHDYRYFPEPDLVPVDVSGEWLTTIRHSLCELPTVRKRRFQSHFGLNDYDAGVLVSDPQLASYFDKLATLAGPKAAANWLLNSVLQILNENKQGFESWPIEAEALAELIKLESEAAVSGLVARTIVLPAMVETGASAQAVIAKRSLAQQSDAAALLPIVEKVLDRHRGPVQQYLGGKTAVVGFLVGMCMKSSEGKGNPKVFRELLETALAKLQA